MKQWIISKKYLYKNYGMTTSVKKGVQQFLSLCKSHGLKKIIFSPGSRSAPLVLGFANSDAFETYIIPDERSAAFYALGMAEELNEVVAVVCTSGSALLNYYPAISEAFYRNIPLMVISADRPLEWTDQGDGQTIRQEHVFQNHILAQTTLFEAPKDKDQQWFNRRETSRLFNKAMCSAGGPVHINFPFSEPLYEIEKVELEERHTDLQKRARRVAGRIKNIGGSKVPDELESCNRRLLAIEDKLSGQPSLSDSDLDEVADFIDEQEMQIEDLDEVDEITDLQIRVDELQAEIEQLEEQKNTLLRIIEAGGSMVQS